MNLYMYMYLYNKPFSFGGCRESILSSLIRILLSLNNLSNKLHSIPAIRHTLSLSEGKCTAILSLRYVN